jgi:SAM-dependent methyltransferase
VSGDTALELEAIVELEAIDLYGTELLRAASLPAGGVQLRVVDSEGGEFPLALARYLGHVTPEETSVLERAIGPVLDVGCGPGRHVLALNRRGVDALGVDISPLAVELARARGARVIEGSIFDRVPHAGSWGSALLLDGNIGIGGSPEKLIGRIGDLLREDGALLIEVEAPGVRTHSLRVSLEAGLTRSRWFPWARVGIDGLDRAAAHAGFAVTESWRVGDRWFASLARSRGSRHARQRL